MRAKGVLYNAAAVETVSGTIESVDMVTPMKGMNYGVHVMVKTDKETIRCTFARAGTSKDLTLSLKKGIR